MDMIRHNDRGVKVIPLETTVSVKNRIFNYLGNLRSTEVARSVLGSVQDAVKSDKSLPRGQLACREYPIPRQTPVQAESQENRLPNNVKKWQPAFVKDHRRYGVPGVTDSHAQAPERRLAGRIACPTKD
jgi:hypothetical protein